MSDITQYNGGRGRYRLSRICKKRRIKWHDIQGIYTETHRFPPRHAADITSRNFQNTSGNGGVIGRRENYNTEPDEIANDKGQ